MYKTNLESVSGFIKDINPRTETLNSAQSSPDAEDIDYEILPDGWWRIPSQRSTLRKSFKNPKHYEDFIERLNYVDSFGPKSVFRSKFDQQGDGYYIFVFHNNVVAECPKYGNAVYVLVENQNWRNVFRRSRQELRADFKNSVINIRHTKTWKERLKPYLI